MDELDLKIIELLEQDGRISHEEISKQLHISRPAVHQRVAKLEKMGVIHGYRAVIDWSKLEQKIKVLIFVKVKCKNFNEIAQQIVDLRIEGTTIIEGQRLAGEWCLLLKVRVGDPEDLTRLLDCIVQIPEVQETSTTFILSTIYENGQNWL
ncbi:Lrp/AsnC family transcriptional regulator [Paenibacillus sp. HN-1]|nr:Lrp/AsnC family transcriptional regulator [Paenibacillus sinensis]MBY9078077.1 Lrp/AsnC family transcriptional regulator [Paenibacillus sp. CGMCC 1.18879]MBY9083818.1 Lrp/AsnC family transcriptional regulator [Paenibacillus sinensis]